MKSVVADARPLEEDVDGDQVDGDEERDWGEDDEDRSGEVIDGRFVDVDDQGRDDERNGRLEAGEEGEDLTEFGLRDDFGQHRTNHDGRSRWKDGDSGTCKKKLK